MNAPKAWEPIGWRVVQHASEKPNTAHLWIQSRHADRTHSACDMYTADLSRLLPESEAQRRCTKCSKTMVSQWFDIHGEPKMETQKNFPATVTVHTPQGPTHCCAKHAHWVENLFSTMGAYTNSTKAPEGAQCANCNIEAKESK